MPSRDLLETQGRDSGPDAGAGSPTAPHSSDSWLDNAQWKQKKEALWWESHQMTARSHAPPHLEVLQPSPGAPETTQRESAL